MYHLKYQHVLRTMLCVTALTSTDPVTARKTAYEEGEDHLIQMRTSNFPQEKADRIENDLEGQNLIGSSHFIFKSEPHKNEWEYKEPEGRVNGQKYNLAGIALFAGRDPISHGIETITGSKFSHVGAILSDANDDNKWFCFESTGTKGEVLRGKYPHVRITPWNTVVKNYNGKVSYRLFLYQNMKKIDSAEVTKFAEKYNGKSYTKNPFKLLKAVLKENKKSKSEILKTAFCSELVAKMLMEVGIIEEGVASNYIPKDFTYNRDFFLNSAVPLTPEFKAK